MTEYNEDLDGEFGYKGISRFTCYKPTYTVDEWENGEIIREWDIMRVKEDYFSFLVYMNNIVREKKRLEQDNQRLRNTNRRLRKEYDKMYDLCKEHFTDEEIIKELSR